MTPKDNGQWLDELLAQRDYEITGVPKHWEPTAEKIAIDGKFKQAILAELKKREAEARIDQTRLILEQTKSAYHKDSSVCRLQTMNREMLLATNAVCAAYISIYEPNNN